MGKLPLLQATPTFNSECGFSLCAPSPALVHTSIFRLHLQNLELCWILLPLDFVFLRGLDELMALEPFHNLWRRPEVARQDDWMALQSCLVLHLPGDLDVVICKAGLGKKKGSIWRKVSNMFLIRPMNFTYVIRNCFVNCSDCTTSFSYGADVLWS